MLQLSTFRCVEPKVLFFNALMTTMLFEWFAYCVYSNF
uniref:Uncharacterized protein n=1 Tax=Anguilla anguilla TaxID=7936 RepID=A0A0E9V9C5_ANGAN